MIDTSVEYKNAIYSNNPIYGKLEIKLKNGATVTIGDELIMSDGIKIEEAVSDSNSFDVGAVIINKCTTGLYNDDEIALDKYDFAEAKVIPYIGILLDNSTIEWIKRGVYTVDIAKNVSYGISLECLDNMAKLDKPYESQLTFPATLYDVVKEITLNCEVGFIQDDFFNAGYKIERPSGENLTYRLVLSYVAQLAGCYAKCNTDGELELKWYNTVVLGDLADGGIFDYYNEFVYETGKDLEGGDFIDYSSGDTFSAGLFADMSKYTDIADLSAQDIGETTLEITGVKAKLKIKKDDEEETTEEEKLYLYGKEGYVIDFSSNPLLNEKNVEELLSIIGEKIIGMKFHPFTVTAPSDPSIEAGDLAVIVDRNGKAYQSIVTNISFDIGGGENFICGAKTEADNSSLRPTTIDVAKAEIKKDTETQVQNKITAYDNEVKMLTGLMAATLGSFKTEKKDSEGRVTYYIHDKPTLESSSKIWKMGIDGFTVSTDGGKTWNAGLTADGKAVLNLLSVIGISFDWATGGTLTLGGANNVDGKAIIKNASGKDIIKMDSSGIELASGASLVSSDGVSGNLQFISNGGNPSPLGWSLSGQLFVAAYIPQNYVVKSAYVRLVSAPAYWTNPSDDKTYTGYSRNIELLSGGEGEIAIHGYWYGEYAPIINNYEVVTTNIGDFKNKPNGASSGSKTLSTGDIKSLLKAGKTNMFAVKSTVSQTTDMLTLSQQTGSGILIVDVYGYAKN